MNEYNPALGARPGGDPAGRTTPGGLSALVQRAWELAFESDVSALLRLLADDATRVLEANRAAIFFLEDETHELVSLVASDVSSTIRFHMSQGIAGAVARSGLPIRVEDAYRDHRFYGGVDRWTGYATKTVLAEPLKDIRQKTIGVFEILNRKAGTFSEKDQTKLRLRARLASSIIEAARLIRWLKRFGVGPGMEPDFESQPLVPLREAVAGLERRMIQATLEACGGNRSQAAKMLVLTRQGLTNKILRYQLRPGRGDIEAKLFKRPADAVGAAPKPGPAGRPPSSRGRSGPVRKGRRSRSGGRRR